MGGRGANNMERLTGGGRAWERMNQKIAADFDRWLGGNSKESFEADQYNVFDKLSLKEVREWLRPGGYYDDEVPQDESWVVVYKDGSYVLLGEGDSLKGIKRSNILYAVNENGSTTMIYGKPEDIGIQNISDEEEHNDIWRVYDKRDRGIL